MDSWGFTHRAQDGYVAEQGLGEAWQGGKVSYEEGNRLCKGPEAQIQES